MAAIIDKNGNIVIESNSDDTRESIDESESESESVECEHHEWEFKKQGKECLICNKQENYLDDPFETHVHKWVDNQIPDKPNLSVCILCGKTKYNFNCGDNGNEGFFDFTSDTIEFPDSNIKTVKKPTRLPKFKNRLPKVEIAKTKSQSDDLRNNRDPVGKLFLDWKLKNPNKLSFIRKSLTS